VLSVCSCSNTTHTPEAKPKGKNRKLVVELEPDLYDAFALACFTNKKKMAKLVREWIKGFTEEHQ
jgi:hypothetical protein